MLTKTIMIMLTTSLINSTPGQMMITATLSQPVATIIHLKKVDNKKTRSSIIQKILLAAKNKQ